MTSPLKDCSVYPVKNRITLSATSTNFADYRSLSWEYSPPTMSDCTVGNCPKMNISYGVPGKRATRSDTQPPMTSIQYEGPMEIDMESDEDITGNVRGSGEAIQDIGVAHCPSSAGGKLPSPDLIPSPCPEQMNDCHFSREDQPVNRNIISKSSSLTSLHPSRSGYFRTMSPQASSPDGSSFQRTLSTQSLYNMQVGSKADSLSVGNRLSYGLTSCSKRDSPGIKTGTMETISNLIISNSGVSPKLRTQGPARRSPAMHRPRSVPTSPDLPVSNVVTSTDVNLTPLKYQPSTEIIQPSFVSGMEQSPTPDSIAVKSSGVQNAPKGQVLASSCASHLGTPITQSSTISSTPRADVASPTSSKKPVALTKSNIMTSQVDSVMLLSLAGSGVTSPPTSVLCIPGAKEYIMDKYFEEIAKSWDQLDANSSDGAPDVTACGREFSTQGSQRAAQWPMLCSCGEVRSEQGVQAEDSISLHDHRAPCVHKKKDVHNSYSSSNLRMYTQVEDLIHLEEPHTEEAVIKTLQARYYTRQYYTRIGPLLVMVNPLTYAPAPCPISLSTTPDDSHLQRIVNETSKQQMETGLSQTMLLNGVSGSGKTYAAMVLLRQLFSVAGGGAETDSFKHIQAALTVLRALGSAATCQNPHSSRMGYLIENDISDGAIYRNKIHCYFLDQIRVEQPQANEKNFHIFYQMLAGLSLEERARYHLTGHSSHTLNFLCSGDVTQDDTRDRDHFVAWKNALSVLGIPFADIMRALAAVLLLGNVRFVEGPGLDLQVEGETEMQSVASLLGVTTQSLYRGLTTRTRRARGQIFKALADPHTANQARVSLAKALYCRLVSAIIKRANNTKRIIVNCANSTDSGDSGQNDAAQQEAPLCRSGISHASGQVTTTSQTESFIAVLDMFGFEKLQTNHFEQLCINLCSETLQHFYNTHMFRASEEACAEEAITADIDVAYVDNAPTIELLSSPRVGLLSLLDAECSLQRGCPETLLQKVHIQHSRNKRFFEPPAQSSYCFGIRHFCGNVTYDSINLLEANRNQLADDIIATFTKQNCSFGFVSHLFSQEIKAIQEDGGGPKGAVYRISPSPVVDRSGDLKGSLSSDFHTKLDGILQLLVSSKPHFIRCIKSNDNHQKELFEREVVKQQLRSLQLLETLHLMAAGFAHRLRYRVFNGRYQILVKNKNSQADKQYAESKIILEKLLRTLDESGVSSSNVHWALGKKHIFLSEGCRQVLENLRDQKRHQAATVVQSRWRQRMCQKKWPTLKRQLLMRKRDRQPIRKHVRRNSLLEGAALQKLQNDQQLHQPPSQCSGSMTFVNGTSLQTNVSGNGTRCTDKRGPLYGSYNSLHGQNAQVRKNQTQDTNSCHVYGSFDSLTTTKTPYVYSKDVQRTPVSQHPSDHQQGSHVYTDQSNMRSQSMGPGRYSFHGDTRQARATARDVCNQRPRSRSSERFYISHTEYQIQHNTRPRSYSSNSKFRESLPQQDQPQVQRHLHNGQESRLSQNPHTNSASVQNGLQTKGITNGQFDSINPHNIYNRYDRTNKCISDSNSKSRTCHPHSYNSNLSQKMTNGIEAPSSKNQYYKDNVKLEDVTPVNNHAPAARDQAPKASNDLRVTFSPSENHPPPVPASRTYTVKGNMKLGYPQIRIMKQNFQEHATSTELTKGQEIKVVGSANKRGYLVVEHGADLLHVPFHLTELKTMPLTQPGIDV